MDLQTQITQYWSDRAAHYAACRLRELEQGQFSAWQRVLLHLLGDGAGRIALDAGTGSGFLALILDSLHFQVTGIDPSEQMLGTARASAQTLDCTNVQFEAMDAQSLRYTDACFDLVISRNVTWTLPDPQKAYQEWWRVLKPGGLLLNIDGNYQDLFANPGAGSVPAQMSVRREEFAQQLSVNHAQRPQWDFNALYACGFDEITVCRDFPGQTARILKSDCPLERSGTFLITAIK